jgi:hypothetical protein
VSSPHHCNVNVPPYLGESHSSPRYRYIEGARGNITP